jgi:hypothetical protein
MLGVNHGKAFYAKRVETSSGGETCRPDEIRDTSEMQSPLRASSGIDPLFKAREPMTRD